MGEVSKVGKIRVGWVRVYLEQKCMDHQHLRNGQRKMCEPVKEIDWIEGEGTWDYDFIECREGDLEENFLILSNAVENERKLPLS